MSRDADPLPERRRLLMAGAAALAAVAGPARASAAAPPGLVLPRPAAPGLPIVTSDGQPSTLPATLQGHVTAVQLMFTGCSTSCPPQGALFAAVAARLAKAGPRLLSLSIDALGDDARSLSAWLERFGRHPHWTAGVPRPGAVESLIAHLRGAAPDRISHTTQVYLFDRNARLAFRTAENPPAALVADLLLQLQRA